MLHGKIKNNIAIIMLYTILLIYSTIIKTNIFVSKHENKPTNKQTIKEKILSVVFLTFIKSNDNNDC